LHIVLFDFGVAPDFPSGCGSGDSRADLFTLGRFLVEVITGSATVAESKEWAVPESCPTILRLIIEKLLEPSPQKRYQTAHGVMCDLRLFIGGMRLVEVGAQDDPELLRPPQHIYCREKEIGSLLDAVRKAKLGICTFATVCGPSGSGVSALINFFRCHFSAGMTMAYAVFQKPSRIQPLGALLAAIDYAIAELLKDADDGAALRRKAVINTILPHVPDLMGRLDNLRQLLELTSTPMPSETQSQREDTANARSRLAIAIEVALVALSMPEKPLVFILEDSHLADVASLRVLGELLASHPSDCHAVLLLGYAVDDVYSGHPLRMFLDQPAIAHCTAHKIHEFLIRPPM
jgi:hypothetical protein